jgi:hypothetical protein
MLAPSASTYLVAPAQHAEQAGFSTLLIRDHLVDTPFPS